MTSWCGRGRRDGFCRKASPRAYLACTTAAAVSAPAETTTGELDALRERLIALASEASPEDLRRAVAFLEVAAVGSAAPAVPASLVRPSDGELARELNERAARDERVPAEKMYERVVARLA